MSTAAQRFAEMEEHERQMGAALRQVHAEKRILEKALTAHPQLKVTEQLTYSPSGPNSFFLDAARATRLHDKNAQERLDQHQREMEVEIPKRREARDRRAHSAYEEAFAGTPADQERYSRMLAAGVAPFERRALTRTDGQAGFFSPPIYLIDRYVEFAREASPFASLWTNLPLPQHVDQINAPRIALGAATGPQAADIAPAEGRDIQDSLATATVRTVAGISDVSRQWFEQGQGGAGYGVDEVLWADLTADLAQNVDGQCLLGNDGPLGQLLGVWPGGAIAAANGIVVADSNNTASQSWSIASSGSSLQVWTAQTVSKLRTLRAVTGGWDALAWIWHPWVWSLYTGSVDSQNRPLVLGQNLAALPDGAVGEYQNIPVFTDSNVPTTFGGTVAPYMGAISNGQYAAIPGAGGTPNYTPLLLARPKDLYLFQGDIRMQVLEEVVAGSLQVRFRLHCYLASMPHRFVGAAASGSNVSAGGDVAHATLTWNQTNSLLQLASSGY
jgi:hypothetical protein